MNAQGVAVEKRYWRPIMSSLHGMFSLGGMAGAAATGADRRRRARAPAALPRDRRAGRGRSGSPPAGRCCPPRPRGAPAAPASRGRRARSSCPASWRSPACSPRAPIADWSAVYLSASLGAGTTMAAAAFAAFSLAMAAGRFTRRPPGRQARRRSGGAGGRRARRRRPRPHAADRPSVGRGARLRRWSAPACPASFRSCCRRPRGRPGLPPSAAIAAVCTVGYFGFLLGPPAIGGLAELIGLPRALGLVVLLCALIAALGSRAPTERAGAAVSTSA